MLEVFFFCFDERIARARSVDSAVRVRLREYRLFRIERSWRSSCSPSACLHASLWRCWWARRWRSWGVLRLAFISDVVNHPW